MTDGEWQARAEELAGAFREVMDLALRNRLSATVGPVTLEEAFLTIVGRSIDAE